MKANSWEEYLSVLDSQKADQKEADIKCQISFDSTKLTSEILKRSGRVTSSCKNELLIEEALYLIERGSCVCQDRDGARLSVKDVFRMLVSYPDRDVSELDCVQVKNILALNNYITYSHLRRFGYVVERDRSIHFENAKVWIHNWIISSARGRRPVSTLDCRCEIPVERLPRNSAVGLVNSGELVFLHFEIHSGPPSAESPQF